MDGPARPLAVGEDLYSVLGVRQRCVPRCDPSGVPATRHVRVTPTLLGPRKRPSVSVGSQLRTRCWVMTAHAGRYDRRRASTARIDAGGSGPAPTHRAPGPELEPRGAGSCRAGGSGSAIDARSRPASSRTHVRRRVASRHDDRQGARRHRALMVIAFGTMVVVTATSRARPAARAHDLSARRRTGGWTAARRWNPA